MNPKVALLVGILLSISVVSSVNINTQTASSPIRSSPTSHLEHLKSEKIQQLLQHQKSNDGKKKAIEIGDIEDVLDAVNTLATQMMECLIIPGMSIAIIVGNDTYVMALGSQGDGNLVNVDTNFGIGSTSKAFTSLLAGQLVEQGKLSWNQPVKQYLPKFGMFDPVAEARLNIRDMLTHKTGFPDHGYDLGYQVGTNLTRSDLFYAMKYLEPAYDFRSHWEYNNVMIMSAGHIEEEITGKTWEELVSESVFTPLDMRRTCADLSCATRKGNLAMPFVTLQQQAPLVREACGYQCNDVITIADPAGGIYSNVKDMSKWVKLHLNTSSVNLVNDNTLTTLHTPQTSLYPSNSYTAFETSEGLVSIDTHSYAYNWIVENYRGLRHVWHDGATIGFNAQVSMLPDLKIGFVALTNVDGVNSQLIELAYYTFDLLLHGKSWVSEDLLCASSSQKSEPEPVKTRPAQTISTDSLSNYAGTYEHPFYGKITFTVESAELFGTWGDASGSLTYIGDNFFTWLAYDSDFPELYPGSYLEIPVEFLRNIYGEVDSFTAPFQAEVPSMIFTNHKWIPRGVGWPAN